MESALEPTLTGNPMHPTDTKCATRPYGALGGSRTFGPIVRAYPRDDSEFCRRAERLVAETIAPGELEQLLRRRYPHAVVRASEVDGLLFPTWYAYRDGRWSEA